MLTLYGAKGSGAAAVECALKVAKVRFKWIEAASWAPGPGLKKLKKVNPLAQIPTLALDDGSVMTESAAILIWLGQRYPKSGLLPAKPAQALRGLVYIAANCYAAIGVIDYPSRFCKDCDDTTTERIRAGSRARLHEYWDLFSDQFEFLRRGHIGALEILATVVSRWSGARQHLERSRPGFYAKLKQVEADPRLAPVFARHWPAK